MTDPFSEIRMTALHATRGANYWSRRPVTRMDITIGAYEEISSADVPGVAASLIAAMPSLVEHRCSVGERGGFVTRLRRGTYLPHIVEHVALELQSLIGDDVGYGRTRGGDLPNEYTIVIEHRNDVVGLRAAALALDVVTRAFAGRLDSIEPELAELRALSLQPGTTPILAHVRCGVTGGALRAETRSELARLGVGSDSDIIVDVAPSYILQAGLPYARSDAAVVLDDAPTDVPDRYRDPERAARLVSVVADAVVEGGFVVAPAAAWDVQDRARDAGCRVAVFSTDSQISARDKKVACASAWVDGGRIMIEHGDSTVDAGRVSADPQAATQVAAALCASLLGELDADRPTQALAAHGVAER